ncbi:TonB-dependent receptor plug domain-containing protein [Komagataeibacter swingsii]|uniref:TonB-dependent receptor n=1 Tax=Komagataeibacter swingsii TaxID=215220 RepID=A0A2V4RJB5_9PROT|nr:TonB-dependent receptor [Komagataeibacter swingsii]PYD69084.1 TonB-dependent receptor [Komagataeibacter swingsii]GBQ65897.1 TonB-dependent outer membrane receptor [Komagataeibacter swingsii DSM 16373]
MKKIFYITTILSPVALSLMGIHHARAQAVTDNTTTIHKKSARQIIGSATDGTHHRAASDENEQIIVTGTRDPHQTARASVSPIVVVGAKQLQSTGQVDVRDALTQLIPSMTRSDMNIGNAQMTDAIQLRGLTPNQTLVLVNGKRRHTTADISDYAGPQQGSTPVDIDMIPVSSIDHVEILQDGAAAQYGSDAIAGVVNIILKHNNHGFTAQANNGGYYAGDGFTSGESLNWGTKLGNRGFFSLSADYHFQDHTYRGGIDNRTGQYDNFIMGNPRQERETVSYNMEYNITKDVKFYSFATFGHRNAESYQNFRTPALADSLGLSSIYPNGFSPQLALDENDYAVTGGFKGTKFGWDWDVSTTYGGDNVDIGFYETANPSLMAATGSTPTKFGNIMSYSNTQWTTDAGLRHAFNVPLLAGPLNFAIGAQYRYDTYNINAGSPDAYYGSSTAGEAALAPVDGSHSGRDVTAGYMNVSTRLLPKWQVDLAGRVEHYTDSGGINTETGKFSTRYDFNKYFSLRGTIANGFRAPTLAEEHYTSLEVSPTGAAGILATTSPAARSLGSKDLKPERSMNYSAGIILNPMRNMHITLDAYQITLKDRIMVGGVYNGQQAINAIEADNIILPPGLTATDVSANYFTNAANTRTRGMDISATYLQNLHKFGKIQWDIAVNFNETQITHTGVDGNGNSLLNAQQAAWLTGFTPKNKEIFGGHWFYGKLDVAVHEIRYGHAISQMQYVTGANAYSNSTFLEFVDHPRWQTNLQIGYQVTPQWHLALGANNVGNAKQRKVPTSVNYLGVQNYDYNVQQVGQNGGYYYFQVNYSL